MGKRKQRKSQRRSGNGELLMPASCTSISVAMGQVWMYCVLLSILFKLLIGWLCYLLDARWEEERYTDGVKWKFLEHKGPVFAPPYEPLPSNVKFYYDGKIVFILLTSVKSYTVEPCESMSVMD